MSNFRIYSTLAFSILLINCLGRNISVPTTNDGVNTDRKQTLKYDKMQTIKLEAYIKKEVIKYLHIKSFGINVYFY